MARDHNPGLIRTYLFNRSKAFWGWGLFLKFLIFVGGAIVILAPEYGKAIGYIVVLLGFISELVLWKSDKWKSAAQSLHRKLDFENALGWPIPSSEIADILARFPGKLERVKGDEKGSYFASTEPVGVKRALQNLCESSWWSTHLSESMFGFFITLMIAIVIGCIFLLNVSIEIVPAPGTQSVNATRNIVDANIIKVVTSVFLFILSYGLFRLAAGYFTFSKKSESVKAKAEALLENNCESEVTVIKLWQDYHLFRASAPLVPTLLWRLREKRLNELFNGYFNEIK